MFQLSCHEEDLLIAKLIVYAVFVFIISDLILEVIEKFVINEVLFDLLWNFLNTLVISLSVTAHYFFIKRYPQHAVYFSPVQSVIIIVGVLENKFITEEISNSIHIFISILVLVQSFNFISSCQISIALSYCFIWIFVTARFFTETDVKIIFKTKTSFYFLMTFVAIFLFQRRQMQKRRAAFLDKLDLDETFSLVHKLMRVYHDGIVLTNGKEIVFKNKLLSELLLWPFKTFSTALKGKLIKRKKSSVNKEMVVDLEVGRKSDDISV